MMEQLEFTPAVIATLAAFAIVQIADVYTTIRGMKMGASESNPVVAWLMDKLGMGWAIAKLAIASGAAWAILSGGVLWPLWGLTAAMGWVVLHNYRIIQKRARQ